ALIKSPRCSANPTTCGPISLWRFSARSKPRPRTSAHWYCCDSSVSRLARCAPASTTPARKPGLAISSKTAHPTAVANALPLNAPLAPVRETASVLVRDKRAEGNTAAKPFSQNHHVRLNAGVLKGEESSSSADPRLNFIEDQKDAMPLGQRAQVA